MNEYADLLRGLVSTGTDVYKATQGTPQTGVVNKPPAQAVNPSPMNWKPWLIGGAVVAVLAVVYFVLRKK
jgi:hypothetical protein